ncbi:Tudor domain containing protein [Trichomonas vaginalis G3]|uniref:Tudor domain containing protein n=1 Tax=Trichomonas vaginalis (strain ATCC PRA-98 / G3) TaxID=412133 RepID=A2FLL5_TRIV3|nr:gamete generation protein family [Trichomonas vaginalis G3]EAX94188.1 Tudor domain containing protein [Trichomonas vaginalis G3]KAI5498410.1 gamete generation protein family [Trichomonas vaginalis G3]|eukprot:XP_001307118.1 Tudor domain containing protein [Trichomonas vaginalis G3]
MTDSEGPIYEWRRASVIAVLSGDTICVKYTGFETGNKVIKIAGCQAPNLSFFTSSGVDEPYGIEAWKALRSILKTKTVLLRVPEISRSSELIKVPLIGEVEVITTEVRTVHDGKDVCERLIVTGCAKRINDFDPERLKPLESQAKSKNLGIWSTSKKLECGPPNIEQIYQKTEFTAFLTDFDNNCTATLYLPEETAIVELEICGIFMPPMPPEFRNEVNRFIADLLLSEHLRVRVLQINKKKMLMGVITVNGLDFASILLQKGYAMLNEVTCFYRSDSNNLEVFEKRAINRKLGLWQTYLPLQDPPLPPEFEGTIIEIISTSKLSIRPKDQQHEVIITLNAILVPAFGVNITSEPGGYEAYEYLREQVGKTVRVEVNDTFGDINYGTVHVRQSANAEVMIQEYMVKNGLATICSSGVIKPPKGMKAIEAAAGKAPQPQQKRAISYIVPSEMQLSEFARTTGEKKKQGIISAVYSPMSFLIDVLDPNYRIQFSLKDIEAFSPEEYITEVAVDYLRTNYLNREITFVIGGTDISNGTVSGYFGMGENNADIRIDLLKNGYVRLLKDDNLKQYQKQAQDAKIGDWSRAKRLFPIPPQPPALVSVYVTKVIDPLTIAVQTKPNSMNSIRFESLDLMPNPKQGNLVLFVRNNFAYRALVKKVEGHAVTLHLIDYGFVVHGLIEELRRITDQLAGIQAIGMTMKLAFLSLFDTNQDMVVRYLHNTIGSKQALQAHVVGTASAPEVILTVGETLDTMSLQYLMIRDGAAKPGRDIPDTDHPLYGDLVKHLLEAEKTAKTSDLGFYNKKY